MTARRWLAGCALLAAAVSGSAGGAELRIERAPALYAPTEQPGVAYAASAAATLVVEDWQGRRRWQLELKPGKGTVTVPQLPPGYYEIVLGQGEGQRRRALAVLPPADRRSSTFGVMTHFAQGWNTDIVPAITRAGIGTVRDEQYWENIEPRPGEYVTPEPYARYLGSLREHGIEPLQVLSFANPHYDQGQTPFSPTGRAAFAAYGRELVRRHAGTLRAVEVWNEINGTFCSGPCKTDRAGTYAALLADSYAALKAENPGLVVVGGAAVKVPLPWFEALLERGAARHWDAVAVHPYMEPEAAGRSIAALRTALRAAGSDAPIWATEFGTGAGRTDVRDRRETAAYLVRMAVVLRAAGVERLYWYLLRDYHDFQGMGLLRGENDALGRYAPTPAYAAYATLIGALDGADDIARTPTDPRTHVYRIRRRGETIHVLWAPDGPVPATVELPDGGVLTDLVGRRQALPAGANALTLDPVPQYLHGAVQQIDAPRPDVLLAETGGDSDPDAAGSWYPGAYRMPPAPGATDPCPQPAGARETLQRRSNAWEYFHGDPRWPALRVGAGTLHPAADKGEALWAVRGYRSDTARSLRVRGAFSRKGKGDGAGTCILLDGTPVFAAQLPAGGRQRQEFDLQVQVNAGSRIEFVATPGPALDTTYDAVGLSARILRRSGDE